MARRGRTDGAERAASPILDRDGCRWQLEIREASDYFASEEVDTARDSRVAGHPPSWIAPDRIPDRGCTARVSRPLRYLGLAVRLRSSGVLDGCGGSELARRPGRGQRHDTGIPGPEAVAMDRARARQPDRGPSGHRYGVGGGGEPTWIIDPTSLSGIAGLYAKVLVLHLLVSSLVFHLIERSLRQREAGMESSSPLPDRTPAPPPRARSVPARPAARAIESRAAPPPHAGSLRRSPHHGGLGDAAAALSRCPARGRGHRWASGAPLALGGPRRGRRGRAATRWPYRTCVL